MRTVLLAVLLTSVVLSGCVDTTGDAGGEVPGPYTPDPELTEKPEKRFEPQLRLQADAVFLDQGATARLSFHVTDLDDYPFPPTFIDWSLVYDGAPNPVAEGDANELPGLYEQVLHRKGFHNYTFFVDDGQGFADNATISFWVGPLPEPPEPEGPAPDVYVHDWTAYIPLDCYGCVDSNPEGLSPAGYAGALACAGFMAGINHQDCTWVHLSEASWGHPFEVSSVVDGIPEVTGTGPGSVDVEFFEACHVNEPDPEAGPDQSTGSLGHDFIDPSTDVAAGVIPEGAGCMVAFEFAWPSAGSTFHFRWTEDLGDGLDGVFEVIQTMPTADGPCSIPELQACGPDNCAGLATGWNGYGCAWVEVTPGMWGATLDVLGVDPDARALDACAPDARVLESYGSIGPEVGELAGHAIPEGTRCLMAYEFNGHPGPLVIDIYHLA